MDPIENQKPPSEIARALAVISSVSRGLPASFSAAEENRYPGSYGPPNRVDEGVKLRDVWTAINKRRWLIVLIVVFITTATAVMLARKPDIFLAETDVQVDTEGPASGLTSGKGNIIVDTGTDPSYFNTQLQIVTKPGLLRRVVKTLDLENNPDFLRTQANDTTWQRLLRTFGLGRAPAAADATAKKTDSGKLSLDKEVASASATDNLEESARLEPYVSSLQGGLKVDPIKDDRLQYSETRLISIKFIHANPVVAAMVANAVANAFVLSNMEQKTKFTSTTGDFLQQRIAELQSQIRTDEERLINYAKGHEILSLDAAQNTVVDRLSGLNKALLEAENDRKIAEAAFRVSKEPNAPNVLAEANAKDINESESKLSDLKQKRAQLLVEATEEAPEVKEVEQQITELYKHLKESRARNTNTLLTNLETKYRQSLAREESLRKSFNQQKGETVTQNEAAINYRILEQEIQTNKGLLDSLLQKSKENDVVLAGRPNNISVVDYAIVPDAPAGPQRMSAVMMAL